MECAPLSFPLYLKFPCIKVFVDRYERMNATGPELEGGIRKSPANITWPTFVAGYGSVWFVVHWPSVSMSH